VEISQIVSRFFEAGVDKNQWGVKRTAQPGSFQYEKKMVDVVDMVDVVG